MRSRTPFAVLCMTPFLVSGAYAQFTPGHIFVAVHQGESCLHGEDGIIEIDPITGQWSILADSSDGIILTTGFNGFKTHAAITLSPDENTVYLADQTFIIRSRS